MSIMLVEAVALLVRELCSGCVASITRCFGALDPER